MKLREMPTDVRMLNEQLSDCLEEWEKIVPRPLHQEMVEQWKNEMKNYLAKVSSDDDCEMADSIGTGLLEAYESWASVISNVTTFSGPVDHEKTFALMQRPQTAQRTTDWYTEFKTRLTASEIFKYRPLSRRAK